MSLEKGLRAILIADGTVNGLVASRIYPQRRPTGSSLPALTYQTVYQEITEALAEQAGLRRSRVSVECTDDTYGDTKTLRNAVTAALVDYNGTISGEIIDSIRLEAAVDLDEDLEPASGSVGVFRTILDFIVFHQSS
tara:strand:+ start:7024 stop:7434 length:411 start_codon:yes stop_codon:yes gene_type:complete